MNNDTKRFDVYKTQWGEYKFRIEEDVREIGWYLYVYKDDKCIFDYLQNTLEICKSQAYEEFCVPLDSWEEEK